MSAERGFVNSSEIAKNQDNNVVTRNFQAQMGEVDDVQVVQHYGSSGEDSNPPVGANLAVVIIGNYKITVAEDDGILDDTLSPGEKIVYGSDAGAITSFIRFLKTGILEINGNADFAVRFSELETAFNQLKTDHDALLNEHDLHTHGGVEPGAGTSSAAGTALSPSSADISGAKIDTIKVP